MINYVNVFTVYCNMQPLNLIWDLELETLKRFNAIGLTQRGGLDSHEGLFRKMHLLQKKNPSNFQNLFLTVHFPR